MRDMPFTDDPRVVAERLEAAVADVTSLIEILKDGYMSAEEAEAYRQALDEQQTSRKAGGRSALPIA